MLEMVPKTVADAYAALDHAQRHRRASEVAEKLAILRAAELYEVGEGAVLEGMKRRICCGGDGTPLVGEFLAHELAGIQGITADAALVQIGEVLDLRHRHPALWEAFLEGAVWFWQAARITSECRRLTIESASAVDRRCAHALRAGWPWTRIMHHLDAWVDQADLRGASRREALARGRRRVVIDEIRDGHCEMFGRLSPEDAIAFDQALDSVAATLPAPALPEGADLDASEASRYRRDQRRAAAVGVLARGAFGQEALPVELVVHIDADDPALPAAGPSARDGAGHAGAEDVGRVRPEASGVARVEGWGHLLTALLPEFLAGSRVTVRPVLDPGMVHALDGHQPSERMRRALAVRDPVDVFPFASRPARSCDLDHTRPYRADGASGQTGLHNLGPLSRRAHRAKTHGGWQLAQPAPGVFHWRSPAGYEYVVTARGTTRVAAPPPQPVGGWPRSPAQDHPPDPPPEHPAWDDPPSAESPAWTRSMLLIA